VRRQVKEAPPRTRAHGKYPAVFHNDEKLPLSSKGTHFEFPIKPSSGVVAGSSGFQGGGPPGPVRAFYNNRDRTTFNIGFKDSSKPPRGPRNGRPEPNLPYSLGIYHPAPTFTDTSKYQR
jgi:hypothetical protein